MTSTSSIESTLEACVDRLRKTLGQNLHSCVLYGSGARGDLSPGQSDLNLLIVLRESTPAAHAAIADAIRSPGVIEPFVLGLRGFERSCRSFAIKFRSIQRNHRVLHGVDPISDLLLDDRTVKLECEQSLRNLRLRLVHAFITFGHDASRYTRYLIDSTADAFVILGEVLRLDGEDVPKGFDARLPTFAKAFEADVGVLNDLLEIKRRPRVLSLDEASTLHARLFRVLDSAVLRVERSWTL